MHTVDCVLLVSRGLKSIQSLNIWPIRLRVCDQSDGGYITHVSCNMALEHFQYKSECHSLTSGMVKTASQLTCTNTWPWAVVTDGTANKLSHIMAKLWDCTTSDLKNINLSNKLQGWSQGWQNRGGGLDLPFFPNFWPSLSDTEHE